MTLQSYFRPSSPRQFELSASGSTDFVAEITVERGKVLPNEISHQGGSYGLLYHFDSSPLSGFAVTLYRRR